MKKIITLSLLTSLSINAQRKYISSPTVAYNNETQAKAVGFFLRGAEIDSYEFLQYKYIYKISTPYTGTIFIADTYNVKDRLNASDDYVPSPAVVVENDGYYGSPHLFTTVASLKVRELPNSSSAVWEIY